MQNKNRSIMRNPIWVMTLNRAPRQNGCQVNNHRAVESQASSVTAVDWKTEPAMCSDTGRVYRRRRRRGRLATWRAPPWRAVCPCAPWDWTDGGGRYRREEGAQGQLRARSSPRRVLQVTVRQLPAEALALPQTHAIPEVRLKVSVAILTITYGLVS